MQVALERDGNVAVANFQGRLDSTSVAAVEAQLLGFISDGATRMVFDLGKLDYVSSAGLRVMLVVARRLKGAGGRLVLCNMQPAVHEVFEISGFLSIMAAEATRGAAVAAAAA